eukprot:COSAG01_NODE_2744_length_7150_cov_5.435116_7_plen_84_part_00
MPTTGLAYQLLLLLLPLLLLLLPLLPLLLPRGASEMILGSVVMSGQVVCPADDAATTRPSVGGPGIGAVPAPSHNSAGPISTS